MLIKENKIDTTIKNYDAQEMLQYLITSGKINLSSVQNKLKWIKEIKF